ncbi:MULTISPECIES: trypsin-like peptidase domain-containing protein [unclassified Bradyrhizobium]|uniref:S1C family serine protease n=1 Tax=unclassified Bradyrhizobium TaxID=2631580 RepID=UPI001FFA034D|nr:MULTISPECIES: trypsin-like peptidase domain-containing protein [unclassified Bradyrhizobium]MCK1711325.1 trypsin-like peptidase domain-containing protein [Bradyrhizobium sp. 143]MCK1723934.1 trypsin-like peptidase domain-containing protein [Bradyrhizobium sp. 142]
MTHTKRPFSCRRASMIGGAIASTILSVATGERALAINPAQQALSRGVPMNFIRQIADRGSNVGPDNFADLAERIVPAVVAVSSKAPRSNSLPDQSFGFGQPDEESPPDARDHGTAPKATRTVTIGSGFFISPDGYAVTNSHLVEASDTAEIRTNDKKTYSAKVVGRDSLSDIALIKVDGRSDFSYVQLADQPPRVGDWVLTAGNTFGLGGSVTAGIVSARERNIETGSAQEFIQIDAPINQGDSGGPTFDTSGKVIGVNSMIISPSGGSVGVAFAIPADAVKTVIPQLKDKGTVTRGWMGVEVQSVTAELADSLGGSDLHGAIVARVQENGPAASAGLRTGDVITSVNGEQIKNASELTRKIQATAPGSRIQIAMLRQGKVNPLSVTVGQLPNEPNVFPRIPR